MYKFKLTVLVTLLAVTVSFSQSELIIFPRINLDLAGNHSASAMGQNGSLGVNTGASFGVEVLGRTGEIVGIGGGFMYQLPREQEISGSGNFNFVTIHAVVQIDLTESQSNIVPSLVANIGYNIIFNGEAAYKGPFSLNGGIYLGGGLRLGIGKIFIEGLYKSFGGSATFSSNSSSATVDITYTTFSLGLGLIF